MSSPTGDGTQPNEVKSPEIEGGTAPSPPPPPPPPPIHGGTAGTSPQGWWENPVLVIAGLFLLCVFGLVLVWIKRQWSLRTKLIITGVTLAVFAVLMVVGNLNPPESKESASSTTTEVSSTSTQQITSTSTSISTSTTTTQPPTTTTAPTTTSTTIDPVAFWLVRVQEKSVGYVGPDQVTSLTFSGSVMKIVTRIGPGPRFSPQRGLAAMVCFAARDAGWNEDIEVRASDGLTVLAWTGADNSGCRGY